MNQEPTVPMTEVLDITNTYRLKGNTFTRKQRVSSFISKHQEGDYIIHTRGSQARVSNGSIIEGIVSTKALVDKAFRLVK